MRPSESGNSQSQPQPRDPNTDPTWADQVSYARNELASLTPERQQQLFEDASEIVRGGHQTVVFVERATPEQVARQGLLGQILDVVMLDLHRNGPESAQATSRDLAKEFGTTRKKGLPGGAPRPAPAPVGEGAGRADVDLGEFLNRQTPPPSADGRAITLARANEIYGQLATATFDHPTDGPLPIPTEHPEDGCYIRAHLWAQRLREWGVDVKKVFIGRDGDGLVTHSANAFGATKDNPRPVAWQYHVAPLVTIDLGNGGPVLEVVLDPAMGQGVVPVRKWIEMAGVTDGFDEADLYDAKPYPGYQGPLGPGETRLLITDAHAIWPPWLKGDSPATFDEASDLVRSWHDRTREYSIEATERRQFRDWHAALPDGARARFNTLNNALDDAGRRDFHDWFRSLSHQERTAFADKLANDDTTVPDLVPAWEDRVRSARTHLGKLPADKYTEVRNAAELIVVVHHETPLEAGDRKDLIDKITDMVAYRHHTEGADKAWELSQRLATEHGTAPRLPDDLANVDPDSWWSGLDLSLPLPADPNTGADPQVPWGNDGPTDLSWLDLGLDSLLAGTDTAATAAAGE
ncbi:MAG: protein-glutamine glutaminase family protein, partial [Actinomycetota bacterium]|nr:protein-glutamine glutaminase family protein [Actinomycetota bacterium]